MSIDDEIRDLELKITELKKKKAGIWPKKTKYHIHADEDHNWHKGSELGLSDSAMENVFRATGYEVTFDLLVYEDGRAFATHVNGMPLTSAVEI